MIDIDEHYFETEEGQHLAGSHRYLTSARILFSCKEGRQQGRALQTPILHLIGHGSELLLKYPILRKGIDARSYGHDLVRLWNADENAELRSLILETAGHAWARAADQKSKYPKDDFSQNPSEVLTRALMKLSHLHGKGSDHGLRYTVKKNTPAPRPAFLIDTFGRVAEILTMNPQLLTWR